MRNLEIFGHYYRYFKGDWGVPTRITVIDIDGDTATIVRSHITREELAERADTIDEALRCMCLTKMQCNVNKIITKLSDKQRKKLHIEDKEAEKIGRQFEACKKSLCI